ncbi:MAG: radical SAM protein [Candidatus Margulisiibacteriota bacterium]
MYKHIFGPVNSRRLGVSLGVDLLPAKTCDLDCVYCECGKTTKLTMQRQLFVSTKDVQAELDLFLASSPVLDHISFSGAGEPTLASNIGEIIQYIKTKYPQYKVAVLTNGTLLSQAALRQELMPADLVVPSIDAATASVFNKINRPVQGLKLEEVLSGLVNFSKEFKGQLWLEIFIVPGVNDTAEEITALKKLLSMIRPAKVQLNSLDRPGTVPETPKASLALLQKIQEDLKPLPVEILGQSKQAREIFSAT